MLQWLSDQVSSFQINHNGHHEAEMTVARHLLYRERAGDALLFLNDRDRTLCLERDEIWELRLYLDDGAKIDAAGSTLANCLDGAKRVLGELRVYPQAA